MKIVMRQPNGAKLATMQGYGASPREMQMATVLKRGYMTVGESIKYPELMGILPIIGAIAAAVPAVAAGVGGLIKTVSGVKSTEAQNKILAQQIAIESKKADQLKIGLMFGIPAALILVFLLTRGKK